MAGNIKLRLDKLKKNSKYVRMDLIMENLACNKVKMFDIRRDGELMARKLKLLLSTQNNDVI